MAAQVATWLELPEKVCEFYVWHMCLADVEALEVCVSQIHILHSIELHISSCRVGDLIMGVFVTIGILQVAREHVVLDELGRRLI